MKTKILSTLFFIGLLFNATVASSQSSTKEDFVKMAIYLSKESGKWSTSNPNYDKENPKSVSRIEIRFKFKLKQSLLHLTHVVYLGETENIITGESYWLWHPGEQRIKYYAINHSGHFTDGETYYFSEKEFTTFQFGYNLDGHIEKHKDENVILSEDEHTSTSSSFKDGKWESTGTYTFKRVKH